MRAATAQLPAIDDSDDSDDSDDKIFTTPDAVVMLDGASAFVPVPVPASIYADHLGRHLRDTLTAQPEADLRGALADAISDTRRRLTCTKASLPRAPSRLPPASATGSTLLVLGDNLVILPDEVRTDERMDALDLAPRRKYRERLSAGSGYDDEHRAILHELQTQRLVSATPWAILATDGAYNTMDQLAQTDWSVLAHAPSD